MAPDPTARAAARVESLSRQLSAARQSDDDERSQLERRSTAAAAAGAFTPASQLSPPHPHSFLFFPLKSNNTKTTQNENAVPSASGT
jgi:hypothetical protein